jgi:DNA helicase-2/ATP-dependent DNA helicase PcrA
VRALWDGDAEARMVGDDIEAFHAKGARLDDIAILVRASFQTRAFEERFITLGVPYRVIGGPRFYERREIRDALAYIRVVVSPADDLAFERIVNVPKRGIGDATVRTIHETARAAGTPLTAAAQALCETDDLRPQSRNALQRLLTDLGRWRSLVSSMNHPELVEVILDESGYTAMWQQDKSADAPGRLENLKELIQALEEFENLTGFLEHVSLVMDNAADSSGDMVNLMTLHGAKGLEFDTVFLPGWEEELFPHQRALDEGGLASLEEERRLAYVGLTRARKKAIISHAANRRIFDRWVSSAPSRFIEELPEDHVEHEGETGLTSGGWGGGYGDTPSWLRPAGAQQAKEPGARWVSASSSDHAFDPGERIFHQKFGYGRITDIDGDKLHIAFEKAGDKTVLASFVEPVG